MSDANSSVQNNSIVWATAQIGHAVRDLPAEVARHDLEPEDNLRTAHINHLRAFQLHFARLILDWNEHRQQGDLRDLPHMLVFAPLLLDSLLSEIRNHDIYSPGRHLLVAGELTRRCNNFINLVQGFGADNLAQFPMLKEIADAVFLAYMPRFDGIHARALQVNLDEANEHLNQELDLYYAQRAGLGV